MMIRWALFGAAIAIFSVMFGFSSIVATLAGMGKILVYVPILGGVRHQQETSPLSQWNESTERQQRASSIKK